VQDYFSVTGSDLQLQTTDRWVMPMKIGPLARKRQINSSDREEEFQTLLS